MYRAERYRALEGWGRKWAVLLLIGLAGAMLTFKVYNMLATQEEELIQADLEQRMGELTVAIEERLESNLESVDSLAGFYTASQEVSWQEFSSFTDHLLRHRPGVQSLQWIPRVPHERREAHETTPLPESGYLRDRVGPAPSIEDYHIRELTEEHVEDGWPAVTAERRDVYYPIYYISPEEELLWGVDIAALATARAAMAEARQTGEMAVTSPIRDQLVWIFRDVSRPAGAVVEDEDDADAADSVPPLEGFVAAAFRTDRIVEEVLDWFLVDDIAIEVWDETATPEALLFRRERPGNEPGGRFLRQTPELVYTDHVQLGQRQWRIRSTPADDFVAARRTAGPLAVLLGGGASTLLLMAYLASVVTRVQRAREEAIDRAVRARQQSVVAELGLTALTELSPQQLMDRACTLLAQVLDVPYAKVLELLPDGSALRLRAGVGWKTGLVGRATVENTQRSQAGYTLESDEPVVVEDMNVETRFVPPLLLVDHDVVSGVSVVIHTEDGPFGVLGVHADYPRQFSANDVAFVQAVANVLGQAILQRRVETELRESEQRFRHMADAAPVLIWVADKDKNCTYVNSQWLAFTGRTLEQESGYGWSEGIHEEDRPRILDLYNAAFDRREPFRFEYRLRRADGVYRWIVAQGVPRYMPDGTFAGYLGSCLDITDQKDAAQQLRTLNETLEQRVTERTAELQHANEALQRQIAERRRAEVELERSNRELEQFAYIASHDLQEPLRKIEGFGEMLASRLGDALDAEARDFLDRMNSASRRMRDLINGLLAYSRVTTRGQPHVAVDLNELVHEVVGDLEMRIRETEAEVNVRSLPVVEGDPIQMRQLFQNLIGNALKFHAPDRSPRVEVEADGEVEHRGVPLCRVLVRDNGIGIEDRYLDRLFVPFQRVHARSRYEGTGIGLAVCRRIVERHGGTITVASTPGEGSTFAIALPCQKKGGNGS